MLVKAFKTTQIDGGSALYTSPEMILIMRSSAAPPNYSPNAIKARDLYSLGIMMQEMLTRRRVYLSYFAK